MSTGTLRPVAAVVALAASGLLLAGCSGDAGEAAASDASTSPTPAEVASETAVPEPSADPADDAGAGDAGEAETEASADTVRGTAVVAGVEYELHDVRRCEPTDVDQVDRELELTARGVMPEGEGHDGGDWVQIDVYVQQIAGMDFDQVSWAGPEGVFGTNDATEVTYSGERVSGTAAMVDGLTQTETLTVAYDIEVPDEIIDCRP
ncbi:hypothetical protein [Demequina muriae]|uniref:Lipoprotein n=1 Tax=Demequina muriae TaxID=3051664 RepID=A0ABT8GHI2_9MICO|nr:hypothetical protein [Demequina sp. EGI L300058]MDN4480902.1 hypothetical protein [Demequina sp. EGI L300058]